MEPWQFNQLQSTTQDLLTELRQIKMLLVGFQLDAEKRKQSIEHKVDYDTVFKVKGVD